MNVNFPSAGAQKVAGLWHSNDTLADEGSFFTASSTSAAAGQAAGTAIATTTSVVDDAATASATHAQNVPVMYMANLSSPTDPNAPSIYLKYLRMVIVQVPTSATSWKFAFRADNSPRYTSGGTTITPVNQNTGSSRASKLQLVFGAVLTTPLPSASQRVLGSGQVSGAIPVTLDNWMFTFGDVVMPTSMIGTMTLVKNVNIPCGPIVIAPGWNVVLEMWGTSNAAAPSWEFELGYAERVSGL